MINWNEVNNLQLDKKKLELTLSDLIKENASQDKLNEVRAEIKYLDNKIKSLVGTKEFERIEEIAKRKSGIEEKNIKNYNAFKSKYKKISKLKRAYVKMIATIDNIQKRTFVDEQVKVVKVKI